MLFSATVSALVLAGAAAAQNNVQITVGGTGNNVFIFNPPNVTAAVGDVVTFNFAAAPGNHSVTQSSFTDPCDPLGNGFDSGFVQIPAGTTSGFPSWNLTITNTSKPIWFFCKQLAPQPHCNVGMVGSINAPANGTNTFDAYVANAKKHTGNSGESVGFLIGQGASASAVPGPFSGSVTGFDQPNPTAIAPSSVSSGSTGGSAGGSSTTGGAPAATSTGAAVGMKANGLVVLLAAAFGVVLA